MIFYLQKHVTVSSSIATANPLVKGMDPLKSIAAEIEPYLKLKILGDERPVTKFPMPGHIILYFFNHQSSLTKNESFDHKTF